MNTAQFCRVATLTTAGDCADGFVLVSNHRFAPHFASWAAGRKEPVAVIDDGTSSNETRLGAVKELNVAVAFLR